MLSNLQQEVSIHRAGLVYSITCETAIFYVEVVPVFVYIRM